MTTDGTMTIAMMASSVSPAAVLRRQRPENRTIKGRGNPSHCDGRNHDEAKEDPFLKLNHVHPQ